MKEKERGEESVSASQMKPYSCNDKAAVVIYTQYLRHVGYGTVAWLSYDLYGEVGLEGRFIKTGEGSTSKGRFKLCGGHEPNNVNKLKGHFKHTVRKQKHN